MIEIRWHGRGGQGAVTASQVTAEAAIIEGKYAQAFPEFGAERRGAPVKAYTRIDEKPIYIRSPIVEPDIVVILDPSLLVSEPVLEGLKKNGWIIINSKKPVDEIKKTLERSDVRIAKVDADTIALQILKVPIVNTAMLGVLVKATRIVSLDSIIDAVSRRFSERIAKLNIEVIKKAYEEAEVSG